MPGSKDELVECTLPRCLSTWVAQFQYISKPQRGPGAVPLEPVELRGLRLRRIGNTTLNGLWDCLGVVLRNPVCHRFSWFVTSRKDTRDHCAATRDLRLSHSVSGF